MNYEAILDRHKEEVAKEEGKKNWADLLSGGWEDVIDEAFQKAALRAMREVGENIKKQIYVNVAEIERMAEFEVATDTVRAWIDLLTDKTTQP